jgi:hypothetical protein
VILLIRTIELISKPSLHRHFFVIPNPPRDDGFSARMLFQAAIIHQPLGIRAQSDRLAIL